MCALQMKQINLSSLCPWCHMVVETDAHLSFDYDFAQTVLFSSGLQLLLQASPNDTTSTIIIKMFENVQGSSVY